MLLGLGLLEVYLLECLLVESSLRLVLAGCVLALVLALVGVMLVKKVLVLLGAVGDCGGIYPLYPYGYAWAAPSEVAQPAR